MGKAWWRRIWGCSNRYVPRVGGDAPRTHLEPIGHPLGREKPQQHRLGETAVDVDGHPVGARHLRALGVIDRGVAVHHPVDAEFLLHFLLEEVGLHIVLPVK